MCEARRTYAITYEAETCAAEQFDELSVQLIVGIPGTTGHLSRGFEMIEHVNFARWVLERVTGMYATRMPDSYFHGLDSFDKLLLYQRLETPVDHGLVQLRFSLEMLCPNA